MTYSDVDAVRRFCAFEQSMGEATLVALDDYLSDLDRGSKEKIIPRLRALDIRRALEVQLCARLPEVAA